MTLKIQKKVNGIILSYIFQLISFQAYPILKTSKEIQPKMEK